LLISPDGVAPTQTVGVCPLLSSQAPQSPEEAFSWHRLTRVVPEKEPQKGCGVVVVRLKDPRRLENKLVNTSTLQLLYSTTLYLVKNRNHET